MWLGSLRIITLNIYLRSKSRHFAQSYQKLQQTKDIIKKLEQ